MLLWSLISFANAPVPLGVIDGVYREGLEQWPAQLDADQFNDWLETATARAPRSVHAVRLVALKNGVERSLVEALPPVAEVPSKEPWADEQPLFFAADNPGLATGELSGKAVYVSQCHGWIYFDTLGRFGTQRGAYLNTVEDFHNPEGLNVFLQAYLENAGASVFSAKERDLNSEMVLADNDGAGYSDSGGWSNGPLGFKDVAPYAYGVDPFNAGSTRTVAGNSGAEATWTLTSPRSDYYNVYVSWDSDSANNTQAHYQITHPGGVIDRYFDQTRHGATWQYMENLYLAAGSTVTVKLIADSSSGATLSADAVRIGGGVGDVIREGVTTERPRWESGAIQYTQFNGAPSSIYDPYGDGNSGDGGSDPTSRSRWAEWEHPSTEDAVYLSWHSNAASGTARGTTTYHAGNECSIGEINGSADLADLVQDEMVDQFYTFWDSAWNDRGTNQACFAEVSPSNNDEMPAVLVELAFHDNADDTWHLKQPEFRRDAARGMYRGIVRYFAERDGLTPTFLPEPPVGVELVHDGSGELIARWSAGPSGAPLGDPSTTYLVYRSADGLTWDNGRVVNATETPISSVDGETVFVRVVGVNEGGQSFPSRVVGARKAFSGAAQILVVDAFDRLDSGMLSYDYAHSSLGDVVRMNLHAMNDGTIIVAHGQALSDAGWPFDSVLDEALPDLSAYDLVIWATGEESTVDESVSDAQQAVLESYINQGGKLWLSGAEVLWDLDERGSASDLAFASDVLGALMASDDAGTEVVSGEGILSGLDLTFSGGQYPVEYPDVLDSSNAVIARYDGGGVAAVLGDSVSMWGFPFEVIPDSNTRMLVADALVSELIGGVPDPDPTTITPSTDPTTTDPYLPTNPTNPTPTVPTTPPQTGSTTTTTKPAQPPGTTPNLTPPNAARVNPDEKGCGCNGTNQGSWLIGALALLLSTKRRRS